MELEICAAALNGICPYFTMFPLDFPLSILARRATSKEWVIDPFCGRGTTNFAARMLGIGTVGIDSSPVAAAISDAKLASTSPGAIVAEANRILNETRYASRPRGEFWETAYHSDVLKAICRFRKSLLQDCSTDVRRALRGIILGALHGPRQIRFQSYFSNQCTRTYSPKPGYAVSYWRRHKMKPEPRNLEEIIERRASRYFSLTLPKVRGTVKLADSRDAGLFKTTFNRRRFDWVITSPPYYGMYTYVPDQWLRNWFLGGPAQVQYVSQGQMEHTSAEIYADQLRTVWRNLRTVCRPHARLVIRFGAIRDRSVNPADLIKLSLKDSGWILKTLCNAGTALSGKRQAASFLTRLSNPISEIDAWAVLA